MGYKVAVVGATGNVGREMLGVLAERALPADEVVAIASRRSQGTEVSFGERTLKVKAIEHYESAMEHLRSGDWAGFGRELDAMRNILQEMSGQQSTGK